MKLHTNKLLNSFSPSPSFIFPPATCGLPYRASLKAVNSKPKKRIVNIDLYEKVFSGELAKMI
jgi:hypothetical protein